MRMMLLLILLLPCVCNSYSYRYEFEYGRTFRIYLQEDAHTVEFRPSDGSDEQILWYHDNPLETKVSGWRATDYSLTKNLTQKDSGQYVVRDAHTKRLHTDNIKVIAKSENFEVKSFHPFAFTVNLEPSSCNIYFTPESKDEVPIVRQGRALWEFYNCGCQGLNLLKPCGIENDNLLPSCSGRFTVKDNDKQTAMVVTLTVESFDTVPVYLVIIAFVVVVVLVCCCVVRCSFARMNKGQNQSQSAAAPQPAVDCQEYEREPARPTREQRNEPPRNHRVPHPLTHGPLPLDAPPSYSEIISQSPPPPFVSEPGLRYEVSGTNFDFTASAPKYSDIYTSDKLNFL
ncbi:uncharacterized protein LOC114471096 isoform X1 [Gouania willdenowi]|uniref:uncharacterized protein LOC114471096 isoform X1 n=1 Tax=Gouania willdenowi TaxID=441366 RepID=UPI0010560FA5|nr:uncharacterized protein LOC114471096 isoform X1 [Gouania willdenowi]